MQTKDLNSLYQKALQGNIPSHIAIIMDGNGRWANQHHLGRIRGHRKGVQAIREVVAAGNRLGIHYITLYAFSTENWNRPADEVNALWNLMVEFLEKEVPELRQNNVRITCIGKWEAIPGHAREKMTWAMNETMGNTGLVLNLAINYGGRDELVEAIKSMLTEQLKPEDISAECIHEHLYTRHIPDPDLMIRTSGEQRISNFLLWQISYSELYFTPVLWPDFGQKDLVEAVLDYQSRHRRFGGI